MNWIVPISTLLAAVAMMWSVLLAWRVRDWRMVFPTLVLVLITANRLLDLSRPAYHGVPRASDLLGLAISALAVIAVPLLGRMIENRRRFVAAIAQSEARLRQVIDLVPHMIFAKDWDSNFLLANKALAEGYGKKPEDLIGFRQAEFQLSGEELEHFLADDRAVMTSGKPKYIPEEPFTDHEGNIRVVQTTKIPFTASGSTAPAILGVAVDITERKRATESLQRALRELDHRVKNTLALVQSMAEHTATTSESVESFVADFRARIRAMGRVHDALREKQWSGVDLRELITRVVAPYRRHGEDVQTFGETCPIAAGRVQSLGMALHELAANAAKYGALSKGGGRVDVRWCVEKDGVHGATLRIVWQESGGPPVAVPSKRGTGLQIIEEGLRYEIGGNADVRFEPAGVRAEITIPYSPESTENAAEKCEVEDRGAESPRVTGVA